MSSNGRPRTSDSADRSRHRASAGSSSHLGGRSHEELLEPPDVDRVLSDGERVAATVGADLDRRDVAPEPRHLGLDRVRRGWPTGPQHVGQPLGRYRVRNGRDQRREQPPLLRAARRHVDAVAVADDKWTEDFESHRSETLREGFSVVSDRDQWHATRASRRSLPAGAGCGTRTRRRCGCRTRRRSSRRCSSTSAARG